MEQATKVDFYSKLTVTVTRSNLNVTMSTYINIMRWI